MATVEVEADLAEEVSEVEAEKLAELKELDDKRRELLVKSESAKADP